MPALDGLRAFAVTAVIAYHLNLTEAGGGYLGVDIFFVLSGFLITGLLVGERGRTGKIAFGAFWGRRARRLLPALLLMLAALALYAGLGGPGVDGSVLRPDALATLFYSANWHSIFAHQSYFAQFQAPSPLRHTWSLAIEEQFYILWPLMLVLLLRITRGSRRLMVGAILVLAAASATAMAVLYHPGTDPSRIYYGTDTRAFELLLGAALAVLARGRAPSSRPARLTLHGAGLVAIGLVTYVVIDASGPPGWMWQGGLLGIGLLTAIVIASISQDRPGPLGVVFSIRPIRWVGVISYGLYLWHWPVVVLMTDRTTGLSGWPLRGAQVATLFAVATCSYYLVERPIRRARLQGWRGWVAAPAALVVTAVALLAATAAPTAVAAVGSPPVRSPAAGSTLSAGGGSTSVAVVGDSTAWDLALGMGDKAATHGLAVHAGVGLGCSIVDGFTADNEYGSTEQRSESTNCHWRTVWPTQLQDWKPRLVVVMFGPVDTADHLIGGRWLRAGTPEWQAYYQNQLAQMDGLITANGSRMVLATVPQYHHEANADQPSATFADPSRVTALNAVYRTFASAHPDLTLYDLASQVVPGDLSDGVHLTRAGADRVADGVDATLAMIANPTIAFPPGRVLSPADPLRVWIVGDSLTYDASPGMTAALEATGVVKVVANTSYGGWGLTTNTSWKDWPRQISQSRPELVVGMWSWDNQTAQADPVGYSHLVDQALGVLLTPGDGVDGVAIMQLPRSGPGVNEIDPAKRAQQMASIKAGKEAWNSLMAAQASKWPNQYMFLDVASSLEVNGQYSAWLSQPGGTWVRARKIDDAHFCPTGAAVLGQAMLDRLTPVFHLPGPANGWWAGSWTKNPRYNDPPGACPNDQP
jgi:peptidoglycan/LPS O-acetylase OafA/YrhL